MCFTGHRKLTETESEISGRLDALLGALYQRGYRRFLTGGALGFDMLAAERVLALRKARPEVTLVIVMPCAWQTRGWSEEQCRRYERIAVSADEIRVLAQHYYQGCMMVRNRHMVDRASVCVCYLNKLKGGTVSTVAYAARSGLTLLNLAMEDVCGAFVKETEEMNGGL